MRYVLSLARDFPAALEELRDTGKVNFILRLEQIEKRFPGLYNARVGMVDFQDAVAGAPAYDLISLLEDARRDVAPALAETMTARYVRSMDAAAEEAFRASAALLAAQRNLIEGK